MFVIFITDLPEVVEGYCKLYADESKIIRVIEDESSVEIRLTLFITFNEIEAFCKCRLIIIRRTI